MAIVERLFLQHPRTQNESYLQHARFAAGFGSRMALGGFACIVHALVPALCTTSGSRTLRALCDELEHRGRRDPMH